jgi:dipeptidyl aminopeptidase/acylaminoacyl peptidase
MPPQQVLVTDLNDGSTLVLGQGLNPIASPDGRCLAWTNGTSVLESCRQKENGQWGAFGQGKTVFTVANGASQLAWSPDSTRLVFVSSRKTHAFVGLYKHDAKALLWLGPTVDTAMGPAWSPDGKKVAWIRLLAPPADAGRTDFGSESQPFAISVADAETGKARQVWSSVAAGFRGFPDVPGAHPLLWASDDTLLLTAESKEWLHVHALAMDGSLRELTPGACQVSDLALSGDRRQLYFTHNCNDLNGQQLSRVALEGGEPPVLLWGGEGVAGTPVEAGGELLWMQSTWNTPSNPYRMPLGGGTATALQIVGQSVPIALVRPEVVKFQSTDGVEVYGQLFRPPKTDKPVPVVVSLHGGPTWEMFPAWHPVRAYAYSYGFNQYLAQQGIAVLSVNYRGGTGYGYSFRKPRGLGWVDSIEFQDVAAAALWLSKQPGIDASRMGVWGPSYGGYLTLLAMGRKDVNFRVGVDMFGLYSWTQTLTEAWDSKLFLYESRTPEIPTDRSRRAFSSSPESVIQNFRGPVLAIHGDNDSNVPFDQTIELVAAMRARGFDVRELILPNEIHGFQLFRSWVQSLSEGAALLEQELLGAKP